MKLISISKKNLEKLNIVMDLIYDEWGKNFSSSKAEKLNRIKTAILNDEKFPQIYLLTDNDKNLGTFSILEHELKDCDLSPWLACVTIDKKYRGKGFGKILLNHIKEVIERNYSTIYLTTSLNGFYEKIGFELIKIVDNNGYNNRLYRKVSREFL